MPEILPLIMVPENKTVRLIDVRAGRGLCRRLIEMGFSKNTEITVLNSDRGCLIVSVHGSKYAISKGIAMKILVAFENNE